MQHKIESYQIVRQAMQPGDIIAFAGSSKFSKLIRLATGSNVTHIAIVCLSEVEYHGNTTVEIMESVKEDISCETGLPVTGVTRNRLSTKLASYHGDIYWIPLSRQTRTKLDYTAAVNFLMSVTGKPYDMPQAIQSGLDLLDASKWVTYAVEDYSAFFCSELAAAALKAGRVLGPETNPSEMTPVDLIRLPVFAGTYYQLKGDPAEIIM